MTTVNAARCKPASVWLRVGRFEVKRQIRAHDRVARVAGMMFRDRAEAGQKLAAALLPHKVEQPILYALPRGGVAVAAEVANALDAPLELLLVRKIGVPWQPELAMGAVVDGSAPIIFKNSDVLAMTGVSQEEFDAVCRRELDEIERRRAIYLGAREWLDPKDVTAIVIDDGIATGATMTAALRAMRQHHPAKLILAVPVAAQDTIARLGGEADSIVCLDTPANLRAIGYYYRDFAQLTDDDVRKILSTCRRSKGR